MSYPNRSDLNVVRAPQTGTTTAAAGGQTAPVRNTEPAQRYHPTPDSVPKLDDPTARPDEPITHGLSIGPGAGPEAIGRVPVNPMIADLRAAYLNNPTPQLERVLRMMAMKGTI
jgi:hypothetical protein